MTFRIGDSIRVKNKEGNVYTGKISDITIDENMQVIIHLEQNRKYMKSEGEFGKREIKVEEVKEIQLFF